MCLANPAQIIAIDPVRNTATVSLPPMQVEVSLALVEDIAVGDYVLVHVGFALQKLSVDEAEQTLALFADLNAA
jgi:hydrogenase expression/formation protein HypC